MLEGWRGPDAKIQEVVDAEWRKYFHPTVSPPGADRRRRFGPMHHGMRSVQIWWIAIPQVHSRLIFHRPVETRHRSPARGFHFSISAPLKRDCVEVNNIHIPLRRTKRSVVKPVPDSISNEAGRHPTVREA